MYRAVTKPVYVMLESKENLKSASLRDAMFDLLALAVARYGHGFSTVAQQRGIMHLNVATLNTHLILIRRGSEDGAGCQTTLLQLLNYHEHLAEPVADFAALVGTHYQHAIFVDELMAYVVISLAARSDGLR